MSSANARLIAAALAGLVGAAAPVGIDRIAPAIVRPVLRQTKRNEQRYAGGWDGVIRWGYIKRPPQTVAQNKRAAIKAKNRARHRAACRA
jgi:hypothetical protein